jgi:hypothetical protein
MTFNAFCFPMVYNSFVFFKVMCIFYIRKKIESSGKIILLNLSVLYLDADHSLHCIKIHVLKTTKVLSVADISVENHGVEIITLLKRELCKISISEFHIIQFISVSSYDQVIDNLIILPLEFF